MSEIKVNSIKGVGASAAAITVNNTDGTCTANITNNLSNRNLVINGAMQVAQRGTSSTSSGFQTVDRFEVEYSGTDEAPTQAQVDVSAGTTPYTNGFRKAFKITNGNQTSGAGASDRIRYRYKFEAQDIANSGWNYTSASSFVTLSFWIKSSVAQNFYGAFLTMDGSQQEYSFETGSLSADTWTKVTKTIPGNSNLTFNNDNGHGLQFNLFAFLGTSNTGSTTMNQWAAFNNSARTPDNTSTWYTTNNATLEITGLQLEVGSVATDFEHRSFQDEFLRCCRYFYMHARGPDANTSNQAPIGMGYGYTSTDGYVMVQYPVKMRTAPSIYKVTGTDYFQFAYNNNNGYPNDVSLNRIQLTMAEVNFHTGSSWDQNASGMFRTNNTATRLGFEAEL